MDRVSKNQICSKVLAQLDNYAIGDLPSRALTEMELHLNQCIECRRELRVLENVVAMVERMDRCLPPADLWQRVRVQIQEPVSSPWYAHFADRLSYKPLRMVSARSAWPGALLAAATVASLIGAGAYWSIGQGPVSVPAASGTEVASYASQAQQVAYFDPLADRASLGAMAVTTNRPGMDMGSSGLGSPGRVQIMDAVARAGSSSQ